MARLRSAKPPTAVRIRQAPLSLYQFCVAPTINTTPLIIRIIAKRDFTRIIVFSFINTFTCLATAIFPRSVIKYDRRTVEKNMMKLVGSLPVVGPATIVTPPQKIKTPTLNMFIANPFAASPM